VRFHLFASQASIECHIPGSHVDTHYSRVKLAVVRDWAWLLKFQCHTPSAGIHGHCIIVVGHDTRDAVDFERVTNGAQSGSRQRLKHSDALKHPALSDGALVRGRSISLVLQEPPRDESKMQESKCMIHFLCHNLGFFDKKETTFGLPEGFPRLRGCLPSSFSRRKVSMNERSMVIDKSRFRTCPMPELNRGKPQGSICETNELHAVIQSQPALCCRRHRCRASKCGLVPLEERYNRREQCPA
jgi:hypothetical protein